MNLLSGRTFAFLVILASFARAAFCARAKVAAETTASAEQQQPAPSGKDSIQSILRDVGAESSDVADAAANAAARLAAATTSGKTSTTSTSASTSTSSASTTSTSSAPENGDDLESSSSKKKDTDDKGGKVEGEEAPKKEPSNATESAEEVFLPAEGDAEKEHSSSLAIFFVLFVIILVVFLIHGMLQTKCHKLPESLAIVFLGAAIGLIIKLLPSGGAKNLESFSPNAFFLVLLPPIIFESGYNLHKGNFFANLGSICLFAIVGTTISALVVGGGVYLLGQAKIVYELNFIESFAFGCLISAVDPVATLAIFQALDVDPVLNMLVFGESILNDAVAIVLTTVVLESGLPENAALSGGEQLWAGVVRFVVVFCGSAGIGTLVGLISSLVLKHVDLYFNPSLEFALMLCFVYLPYALAEGTHLSGIMSILFCGIVMSQYTHYNLSPVTQITMQQTMRTVSFICESCVFTFLGLAIFSFPHKVEPALIVWSIVFILAGRALNIFPLAELCNRFRQHKITKKMMLVMWFSGLRGAIAYALALHLEFTDDTRKALVTTTLVVVLFTTVVFGGGTMPLMKYLESKKRPSSRHRRGGGGGGGRRKEITMSKTRELGATIDSEHLSEMTEEEFDYSSGGADEGASDCVSAVSGGAATRRVRGFLYLDVKYLRPFFTRRFTQKEVKEGKSHITELTEKWFKDIHQGSPLILSDSDEELRNNEED